MKKSYIEPANTVVKLSLGKMLASSPTQEQRSFKNDTPAVIDLGGNVEMESREVISTPDVWEEW